MSNKAFTLIELLAVIVILAIIALIAVPIVVNIIDDSKKSSNEESIKMYGKAIENAAGNYFLKHPEKKNVTVQNLKDENLINYDGSIVECKVEKIYKSGKIYLKDCTVGGTKVDYTYGEESYKDYIHLIEDADPIGLSPGDKYTYEVNDNDTFYFYILSIEENQVNLIMDRNICGSETDANSTINGVPATEQDKCTIAWRKVNADNSNGPVTAMQGLYNATKNWTNVPNMNLEYLDEGHLGNGSNGYEKIATTQAGIKIISRDGTELTRNGNQTPVILFIEGKPLKARLPKFSEIEMYYYDGRHCSKTGRCPAWLVDNLEIYSTYYSEDTHIQGIKGYWLLSSDSNNSYGALFVYYTGNLVSAHTFVSGDYGIRPVITVPISNF